MLVSDIPLSPFTYDDQECSMRILNVVSSLFVPLFFVTLMRVLQSDRPVRLPTPVSPASSHHSSGSDTPNQNQRSQPGSPGLGSISSSTSGAAGHPGVAQQPPQAVGGTKRSIGIETTEQRPRSRSFGLIPFIPCSKLFTTCVCVCRLGSEAIGLG